MLVLILALILTTIVLTVFAFVFSQEESQPKQDARVSTIPKLEGEISFLKSELEKAKTDYQNIETELGLAREKELGLKEELEKIKSWDNKGQIELEKTKKENLQIKEGLINKEEEAEKQFSINLNLDRELKENKEKLSLVENEKRKALEEVRILNAQIIGLQKEIEKQNKFISEIKKKEEESEWVSKKEYNELKKQLEQKIEGHRELQG